ncbi:hypothetical protein VP01_125g3 [Puccinia sorghi]|uniref:Uncharacterized protein n=1 Tax=Puccinia sorghi TaxID=27349 RepID=A0A0L6VP61_9BASI|nr:hypothetical protein VP01_125g3 [Puccinia sorghi]
MNRIYQTKKPQGHLDDGQLMKEILQGIKKRKSPLAKGSCNSNIVNDLIYNQLSTYLTHVLISSLSAKQTCFVRKKLVMVWSKCFYPRPNPQSASIPSRLTTLIWQVRLEFGASTIAQGNPGFHVKSNFFCEILGSQKPMYHVINVDLFFHLGFSPWIYIFPSLITPTQGTIMKKTLQKANQLQYHKPKHQQKRRSYQAWLKKKSNVNLKDTKTNEGKKSNHIWTRNQQVVLLSFIYNKTNYPWERGPTMGTPESSIHQHLILVSKKCFIDDLSMILFMMNTNPYLLLPLLFSSQPLSQGFNRNLKAEGEAILVLQKIYIDVKLLLDKLCFGWDVIGLINIFVGPSQEKISYTFSYPVLCYNPAHFLFTCTYAKVESSFLPRALKSEKTKIDLTAECNMAQLPAVDMQKFPGSFCCYSNHSPKVIQPSFDAQSLCGAQQALVGLSILTFSFFSQNKQTSIGGGESAGGKLEGGFGFGGLSRHQRRIGQTRVFPEGAAGRKTGRQSARGGGQIGVVLQGVEIGGDSGVPELNGSRVWRCGSFGIKKGGNFVHRYYRIIISEENSGKNWESKLEDHQKAEHSQSLSGLQCAKSAVFRNETKGYSTHIGGTHLPTEMVFLSTPALVKLITKNILKQESSILAMLESVQVDGALALLADSSSCLPFIVGFIAIYDFLFTTLFWFIVMISPVLRLRSFHYTLNVKVALQKETCPTACTLIHSNCADCTGLCQNISICKHVEFGWKLGWSMLHVNCRQLSKFFFSILCIDLEMVVDIMMNSLTNIKISNMYGLKPLGKGLSIYINQEISIFMNSSVKFSHLLEPETYLSGINYGSLNDLRILQPEKSRIIFLEQKKYKFEVLAHIHCKKKTCLTACNYFGTVTANTWSNNRSFLREIQNKKVRKQENIKEELSQHNTYMPLVFSARMWTHAMRPFLLKFLLRQAKKEAFKERGMHQDTGAFLIRRGKIQIINHPISIPPFLSMFFINEFILSYYQLIHHMRSHMPFTLFYSISSIKFLRISVFLKEKLKPPPSTSLIFLLSKILKINAKLRWGLQVGVEKLQVFAINSMNALAGHFCKKNPLNPTIKWMFLTMKQHIKLKRALYNLKCKSMAKNMIMPLSFGHLLDVTNSGTQSSPSDWPECLASFSEERQSADQDAHIHASHIISIISLTSCMNFGRLICIGFMCRETCQNSGKLLWLKFETSEKPRQVCIAFITFSIIEFSMKHVSHISYGNCHFQTSSSSHGRGSGAYFESVLLTSLILPRSNVNEKRAPRCIQRGMLAEAVKKWKYELLGC